MEDAGDMRIKVANYEGFGGIYLGGWNSSESRQTFRLFRCPNCGKIDFYEPSM